MRYLRKTEIDSKSIPTNKNNINKYIIIIIITTIIK